MLRNLKQYADEASIAGFLIMFAIALALGAALVFGSREAVDVVSPDSPPIPPMLADHAERAPDEQRGESVGAAPSKAYPRPQLYLEERGIKYNFYASPNWSSRGLNPIEGIVVHVTGPGTCPGMRSWFANPQSNASAQFGVCKDGSIEQYVEVGDGAWQAGIVNRPDLSNAMIASFVAFGINPNSRTVGIELLLAPGENLNDWPAMRESFYALMTWLKTEIHLPLDRTHVVGHYQIDSVNRSVDPRCCVDIDAVLADLNAGPEPDIWGECDPRWGNCWLTQPAWVFPDGGVCVPDLGKCEPLPSGQ